MNLYLKSISAKQFHFVQFFQAVIRMDLLNELECFARLILTTCLLACVGVCAFAGDKPIDSYRQILSAEQMEVLPAGTNRVCRVKGDKIPDLSARSLMLRPGQLPAEVRYSFAEDARVKTAADALMNWFRPPSGEGQPLFHKTLLIQPGAWATLKGSPDLGNRFATPWKFVVWDGKTNETLWGILLKDQKEINQAGTAIRHDVQTRGGGTVRALKTSEMSKWWPFIGFYIEEPTLIFETKDQKRHYIFGFVDDKVVLVDELDSLPDFQAPP